jgi:hypothetical protein
MSYSTPTFSRSINSTHSNFRCYDFLINANQGAGHADHTRGNGAEVAQDPLSLPSGPITRLRAKRFKEALNGLIQENWADSKKSNKMGSNNNQGLVHVIKAIEEDN